MNNRANPAPRPSSGCNLIVTNGSGAPRRYLPVVPPRCHAGRSQTFAEGTKAAYLLCGAEEDVMASNKELEAGLKAMAADFHLPADGRLKLSKLVAGHLHWFEAAERRGMVWRDMIRALAAIGVTDKQGKPLSIGTLSSAVWRKRAEVKVAVEAADRTGRNPRLSSTNAVAVRSGSAKKSKPQQAGQLQRSMRSASRQNGDPAQPVRPAALRSKGQLAEVRPQNRDVLAFMDRARAVRRRSD